jgi:hypothetical protein
MHHPVQARVGRVDAGPVHHGAVDETVCTCDPGVHWTRVFEFIGWVHPGPTIRECDNSHRCEPDGSHNREFHNSHHRRGYCATWWMARLGSRRRTCQAAISLGDPHGGEEPRISEWESPPQLLRAMGNALN